MTRTAEAPVMPNHAKAIEAAARALAPHVCRPVYNGDCDDQAAGYDHARRIATAAITAFLRTVEASPAMIEAGVGQCDAAWQDDECELYLPDIHKAMSATLANEVEQGDA